MLSAEIGIKAILGIAALAVVFYFLGWFSFKIKKVHSFHNQLEQGFWYLFVGLLQAVSVYALIKTGLQTILLPVPFLLLFLIAKIKPRVKHSIPLSRGAVALFLGATIAVFLVYYLQAFVSRDEALLRFASGDHSFYARVAEYLNVKGKENSTLEYIYPARFTVTPYHYGDIWFCALSSWASQLKAGFALLLVVYPLLAFIFTMGLAGFLLRKLPEGKSGYWVLACIPALFLSGFSFFFPSFLLNADVFNLATAAYPKTLWIACFLMASFLLVHNRNLAALLVLVAVAGLTFINILPSLLGAALLLTLLFLFLRLIQWKEIIAGGLAVVLALAYLVLFYKLLASGGPLVESGHEVSTLLSLKNLRTGINIIAGGSLQLTVLTPFLVLFFVAAILFSRNSPAWRQVLLHPTVLWSVVLVAAGLFSWAVLFPFTTEAVQFFHNVFIPVSAILIGSLVFWILTRIGYWWLKGIALVLLVLSVSKSLVFDFHIGSIHKKEWSDLENFLEGDEKAVFVTIKHIDEFPTLFHKNTRFAHALPSLHYRYTPYINESLNTPFLPVDTASPYKGIEASIISLSSFDYYTKINKVKPTGTERQMEAFVDQAGANYVVVSQKALTPSFLWTRVSDSLSLPEEGWRIYKLKNKPSAIAGKAFAGDTK
jgi:hypothetical protein